MKNRMIKHVLSVFLCAVLMIGISPPVHAGSSDAEIKLQMEAIRDLLQGSNIQYFSNDGQPCSHTSGQACNNCMIKNMLPDAPAPLYTGQQVYTGANSWTCEGFANWFFYNLFNEMPINCQEESITNAKPGDYVRTRTSTGTHAGVFYAWKNDDHTEFYMYDGNHGDFMIHYADMRFKTSEVSLVRHSTKTVRAISGQGGSTPVTPVTPVTFSNFSIIEQSGSTARASVKWTNPAGLRITQVGMMYSKNHIQDETLTLNLINSCLAPDFRFALVTEDLAANFQTIQTAFFREYLENLAGNCTYYVRPYAVDSAGNIYIYSGEYSFQSAQMPVVAPDTVEVWQTNNVVSVSFHAVENTSGYDVYLIQEPWGWEDIKYHISTTATQANFENVAAGDYAAFVIPKNSNPYGPQSPWQSIHIASIAEIPQNVRAEQQGNKMRVTFDPVENALGYTVYVLAPPHYWADLKYSMYTTEPLAEFIDIEPGTYSVFVMTKFADWESPTSAWTYVTYEEPVVVPPAMPSVWQTNNVVSVSFNAVENTSGYDVYLIQEPWGWEDVKYHQFTTETSVTFENVAAGNYGIFVIPKNRNPYGPQSECRYFYVASVADIPQNVHAEQVYNRMQISFDPVVNAIGYNVSLVQPSGTWYDVKYSAYTTETSAVLKDLVPGQYEVYVTARFAEWESPTSAWLPVSYAPPMYEFCLTLPGMLTVIEQEAFAGASAEMLVIPAGVTAIESKAFASCPNLRAIVFEGSPAQIAEDILSGCTNVTIRCKEGSSADRWAQACGYRVEYQ